jgi:hypothetical protein
VAVGSGRGDSGSVTSTTVTAVGVGSCGISVGVGATVATSTKAAPSAVGVKVGIGVRVGRKLVSESPLFRRPDNPQPREVIARMIGKMRIQIGLFSLFRCIDGSCTTYRYWIHSVE